MSRRLGHPGIWLEGNDLLVRPPVKKAPQIKEVLGGRWNKKEKVWKLPPTSLNVLKLEEWYGSEFVDTAPEIIQDLARLPWGFEGWSEEELEIAEEHPSWEILFDFQKECVEYLCSNPHQKSLVVLTPGLGKSAVSVVAADLLDLKKVLILAPVKLAKNWKREIRAWEDGSREVKRATPDDVSPGTEVTVANHEVIQETILKDEKGNIYKEGDEVPYFNKQGICVAMFSVTDKRVVKMWVESGPKKRNPKTKKDEPVRERIIRVRREYADIEWDLVICDESILLKARKAVKTFVLQTLAKTVPWMWFLSGSPTSKYRDDLWRQLNLLFKRGFSAYWRFAEFFCIVEKSQWGWDVVGDNPEVDPQHYLRDFMFVRDQEDVYPELPDYIPMPVEIEMLPRQRSAFDTMLNDWIVLLEEADPDQKVDTSDWDLEDIGLETHAQVGQMTRLLQITSNMCNLPKTAGGRYKAASAKEDLLVEMLGNDEITLPMIVWTWYIPTAKSMYARLDGMKHLKGRVALVTGSTDADETDDLVEAYKAGRYDVIICQMASMKHGFTMTNTRTVFYHDRSFDADAWIQSLRRVRRIGLKHRPVLILPFCEDSMDEVVDLNLEGKMASISNLTNAKLLDLLRRLQPSAIRT